MTRTIRIIFVLLLLAIMVTIIISVAKKQKIRVVFEGNLQQQPVPTILHLFQDPQCGMPIEELQDTAQAAAPNGKTWFFDDVGCLALWLETNRIREKMILWVFSRDTEEWIDARIAWYSRTDDTPMEYGFGAYSEKRSGLISFDEVCLKMLRGENLTNPYVRKELLGNH